MGSVGRVITRSGRAAYFLLRFMVGFVWFGRAWRARSLKELGVWRWGSRDGV